MSELYSQSKSVPGRGLVLYGCFSLPASTCAQLQRQQEWQRFSANCVQPSSFWSPFCLAGHLQEAVGTQNRLALGKPRYFIHSAMLRFPFQHGSWRIFQKQLTLCKQHSLRPFHCPVLDRSLHPHLQGHRLRASSIPRAAREENEQAGSLAEEAAPVFREIRSEKIGSLQDSIAGLTPESPVMC